MAHEKVYGICEDKCKVEVMTAEQTFGITKVTKETSSYASVNMSLPESGTRKVYPFPIGKINVSIPAGMTIKENYYSEIVVRVKERVGHPSDFINIPEVQYLNDYLITSNYDVLHYHFTYDGMSICCWCTGYTQSAIIL